MQDVDPLPAQERRETQDDGEVAAVACAERDAGNAGRLELREERPRAFEGGGAEIESQRPETRRGVEDQLFGAADAVADEQAQDARTRPAAQARSCRSRR